MNDYSKRLHVAREAAAKAGSLINGQIGTVTTDRISKKDLNDLVTDVDVRAQEEIVATIRAAFPDDKFLAEEDDVKEAGWRDACWIVDPLDGTTNFSHGLSPFGVSLAYAEQGVPLVGVVYDPVADEMWTATQGGGVYLNDVPCFVSNCKKLSESLIATGFPYKDFSYLDEYIKTLERVIRSTRGVRRHGAASIDLANVACGRFDGFFEVNLSPWDVAAGILLIREAGGTVVMLDGSESDLSGREVVATNGRIDLVALCGELSGFDSSTVASKSGGA